MTDQRYPLLWPPGWKRTAAPHRRHARFLSKARREVYTASRVLSVHDALGRLLPELRRLGSGTPIISTNIKVRQDGLPYSNQAEPIDPGVAVYFTLRGKPRVLACDTWTRIADNLAAIAKHIEAIRAIDRYGVGSIEQAFAGYQALAEHASPWWTVLEFDTRPTSWPLIEARFELLAKRYHPDKGGEAHIMAKLNAARDAARIDVRG